LILKDGNEELFRRVSNYHSTLLRSLKNEDLIYVQVKPDITPGLTFVLVMTRYIRTAGVFRVDSAEEGAASLYSFGNIKQTNTMQLGSDLYYCIS